MSQPCSTSTWRTMRPSGPVWCVTSGFPRIVRANSAASAGVRTTFTPPPLPRPPAWICAFTTTVPPSRRATSAASSGVRATAPSRTGTPYLRRISFAWNSWMFILIMPPCAWALRARCSDGRRTARRDARCSRARLRLAHHIGDCGSLGSSSEKVAEELFRRLTAGVADGARQGDLLRADDDAVLGVAAVDDTADAHELGGALLFRERTGRVEVLQDRLADRGGTDERRVVVVLRARLEAAAARHATRERISVLLHLLGHARAGAEIVGAVDRHPRAHAFQALEHAAAIDREIAHDRELLHRLEHDRARQRVDERRARLADLPVHEHRARAADLFQAVGVPRDGRRARAVGAQRTELHLHQQRVHVVASAVRDLELVPVRFGVGTRLALHAQPDRVHQLALFSTS